MKFNRSRLLQRPDLEENNYWENGVSKHLVSLFLNWLPGNDYEQQCRIFLACRAVHWLSGTLFTVEWKRNKSFATIPVMVS